MQDGAPALQGTPGEIRFTLEITRAATGKVETIEMVGTPIVDDEAPSEDED